MLTTTVTPQRCLDRNLNNVVVRCWTIFLMALFVVFVGYGKGSCGDFAKQSPRVDYEISDGKAKLRFLGFSQDEVVDVTLDGNSVYAEVFGEPALVSESTDEGFSVPIGSWLEGPGTIEVTLANGAKIVSPVLVTAAAACTSCSPGKWNATRCGSVTSDVGTPPYPCCDNNSDGDATDTGTGGDGNCTWYAWYKAKKVNNWIVPGTWGSATGWCKMAASTAGWEVSSTPKVNSIACSDTLGHVAWVTGVSNDKTQITVEEQNCKCPTVCFASDKRTKVYNSSSFRYISKKVTYSVSPSSTTSGGGSWGSILKLNASISGTTLTLTVTKRDGSAFSSAGTLYFKVGTYEKYGTNRCSLSVKVGDKSKTCSHNLSEFAGPYPKSFYARFESGVGGYAYVGPVTVSAQ